MRDSIVFFRLFFFNEHLKINRNSSESDVNVLHSENDASSRSISICNISNTYCHERELESGNCLTFFPLGLTMQKSQTVKTNTITHAVPPDSTADLSHNRLTMQDLNWDCETVGYLQQIVIYNMRYY